MEAPATPMPIQPAPKDENEAFRCGVCLDLVYKPIVHACGHVFCFWCVHLAMNSVGKSHCALCRSTYTHFPRICELLHKLLAKDFHQEYVERAKETRAQELKQSTFSPDLQDDVEQLAALSKDDLRCKSCDKLLYRPIALNCGHVFCEACIPSCEDNSLKCISCGFPHRIFPLRVCSELKDYLQSAFPEEYKQRHEADSAASSSSTSEDGARHLSKNETPSVDFPQLHPGAGCDACGVYPIVGRRYTCPICNEKKPGYDLCEDCYAKEESHAIGRFNQEHSRDHKMEEVVPLFRTRDATLVMDSDEDEDFWIQENVIIGS